MKVGDKMKPIRVNYAGKVGIIKCTSPMVMSITITDDGEEEGRICRLL